jgi:hypothetical protein
MKRIRDKTRIPESISLQNPIWSLFNGRKSTTKTDFVNANICFKCSID